MKEIGFEPESEEQESKVPFILKLFEVPNNVTGVALEIARDYKNLAEKLCTILPEGTPRTSLLERLLENKDHAVRAVRGVR